MRSTIGTSTSLEVEDKHNHELMGFIISVLNVKGKIITIDFQLSVL